MAESGLLAHQGCCHTWEVNVSGEIAAAKATRLALKRSSKRFALWGLSVYGLLVLAVVFWPRHVDEVFAPALGGFFERLHGLGAPEFINYQALEFSANVLMFVPLGFFLAILFWQRWYLAIPLLCCLSVGVELLQGWLLPGRTPSWSDVLANSLGGLLGALIPGLRYLRQLRQSRHLRN